jgi:hypothetical protein
MRVFDRAWNGWKRIGQIIGDFIGRLVLTIFYFTLFMPFGLGVRIWGDPLDVMSSKKVHWLPRSTHDLNFDDVRRLS